MHQLPRSHTRFLSVQDVVQVVQRRGLPACMAAVANRIEIDFRRWADFDKTARVATHSERGVIELMPIADGARYSFKYVNGHPGNQTLGLPTVMAFGVLADVATGAPLLLSELTLTTAIRTAATSALVARHLARTDSRRMALIGNGAQSEFQALAFRDLAGIRELTLFDTDPDATTRLMDHLQGQGLQVQRCSSVAQAVAGADIVTTITADKRQAAILRPNLIEPGMHINAVGGDCPGKTELHPGVLAGAAVFVEYEPQTRIEGDLQQMPADFPVTEFWRVLTGQALGRSSEQQVTVFDSVGFALEDFSALTMMHEWAHEWDVGELIELVPQLDDPKDLYGRLLSKDTAQHAPGLSRAAGARTVAIAAAIAHEPNLA